MAGAVAERASGGPQPACSVVQDPCRMPGRSDLFPFFFCRPTGIAWFWLDETAVFSCPFLESLLPVSCPGQEHHDDSCRLLRYTSCHSLPSPLVHRHPRPRRVGPSHESDAILVSFPRAWDSWLFECEMHHTSPREWERAGTTTSTTPHARSYRCSTVDLGLRKAKDTHTLLSSSPTSLHRFACYMCIPQFA